MFECAGSWGEGRSMEKRKQLIVNTIFFLIIVGSAYIAAVYLLPIFMPFLVAFLLATVIHAVVSRIPSKSERGRKRISIMLTAVFFILAVVVLCFLGIGLLRLAEKAIINLPRLYEEEFVPWVYSIADRLESRYGGNGIVGFQNIGNSFMEFIQKLEESLSEFSVDKITNVSKYAKIIPGLVIKVVITVVATFFLASDYEKITGFVLKILPERGKNFVVKLKKYSSEVLAAYVRSYSILMVITFVELCIGLGILRIPYFIMISFGIAIFDILPVLGTGGILIPWAAAAVILGNYKLAVGLIVLDFVIMIIRNALEPRIVGKQIGVHPLATLIALFVGLRFCGIIGMVGFPVCLSILIQLNKEGILKKDSSVERY